MTSISGSGGNAAGALFVKDGTVTRTCPRNRRGGTVVCTECEKGRHDRCDGATWDVEVSAGLIECQCGCDE